METGVRGYLLTGSDQFLDPYRKRLVLYPGALGTLVQTASTPRTQRLAVEIQERIDSYTRDYLRRLLRLGHTDLQRARSVVETAEGKRRVDALRGLFRSFEASERRLADMHRADASSSSSTARTITLAALAGVALICLLMALYLQVRVIRPVNALAWSARRVAAGDHSARVDGVRSRNELGEMSVSFNEMAESLERNQRVAEEADQVKEEFFALVSHELRTPLSSIVGYVEVLLEDDERQPLTDGERRRFLEVVDRNAREGTATIGFEAGANDHMRKPFSPQELLARVRSMLASP